MQLWQEKKIKPSGENSLVVTILFLTSCQICSWSEKLEIFDIYGFWISFKWQAWTILNWWNVYWSDHHLARYVQHLATSCQISSTSCQICSWSEKLEIFDIYGFWISFKWQAWTILNWWNVYWSDHRSANVTQRTRFSSTFPLNFFLFRRNEKVVFTQIKIIRWAKEVSVNLHYFRKKIFRRKYVLYSKNRTS